MAIISRSGSKTANGASTNIAPLQTALEGYGSYPTSALGETYGSELLAGVVGFTPDLIGSVGTDGVEGYSEWFSAIRRTLR